MILAQHNRTTKPSPRYSKRIICYIILLFEFRIVILIPCLFVELSIVITNKR